MKQTFLDRYLDYCMPTNHKDEVFKMMQKEDENLEDLLERFQYNLKRAKMSNLDEETLKALVTQQFVTVPVTPHLYTGGHIPQPVRSDMT